MKILILDNNIDPNCWGASDLCQAVSKNFPENTVYVRRPPHEDLPVSPRAFERIIVSGSKTSAMDRSAWVVKLLDFMKTAIAEDIPVLGVCFGHQLLARLYPASSPSLGLSHTPEFGWTEIYLQEKNHPLFKGLPETFYSFSAHFEEIKSLSPNFRSLARSQDCAIQALEVIGKKAFGIQFHPEKNLVEGNRILKERKKSKTPKKLFLDQKGQTLYNPKISEILFSNFLENL